ncbi:hypothetical protein AWB76_07853 [Caballeronia temeraria]|uniref:Uncharacterized protein n=1 Tax=Caballeronia temeraria TaxID=1777137 RepID=A0A158E166_9BURK|nr:hypothetical protein AWB76_07853 [Caballeronia temeraria]
MNSPIHILQDFIEKFFSLCISDQTFNQFLQYFTLFHGITSF